VFPVEYIYPQGVTDATNVSVQDVDGATVSKCDKPLIAFPRFISIQ
jgi:hypothetical protein